jgi:hypothetical protein
MAKRQNPRKKPAKMFLPNVSVWDQIGWGFMKSLHCAQFTGFENGSALITGMIRSKSKRR